MPPPQAVAAATTTATPVAPSARGAHGAERIGATRTHAGAPGTLLELSTEGIRAAERLDFWHHAHLGRMELAFAPQAGSSGGGGGPQRPFEGRVRRILGDDCHVMEHASDPLMARRSQAQCRQDGVDYVSVNLMLACDSALVDHHGQQPLAAGSLYFVDSALPVTFHHARHRSVSIFLPRRRVQEAIGAGVPLRLPVSAPSAEGLGAVLESHMRMLALHAARMTPNERVVAVSACADMALAFMQSSHHHQGNVDAEQFAGGLFEAALRLIGQRCADPQLDPAGVAAALGCSRAALYRLFASQGESVAAAIWAARLERARTLLAAGPPAHLRLADIAFRCGFVDQSGFNRMFKRRFGLTPGQARSGA